MWISALMHVSLCCTCKRGCVCVRICGGWACFSCILTLQGGGEPAVRGNVFDWATHLFLTLPFQSPLALLLLEVSCINSITLATGRPQRLNWVLLYMFLTFIHFLEMYNFMQVNGSKIQKFKNSCLSLYSLELNMQTMHVLYTYHVCK